MFEYCVTMDHCSIRITIYVDRLNKPPTSASTCMLLAGYRCWMAQYPKDAIGRAAYGHEWHAAKVFGHYCLRSHECRVLKTPREWAATCCYVWPAWASTFTKLQLAVPFTTMVENHTRCTLVQLPPNQQTYHLALLA